MDVNKKLFTNESNDIDDLPSTPKKKSHFIEMQYPTQNKIKYRYTIVEKPVTSRLGKLFLIIWLILMLGSFVVSYQSKIANLQISIKDEIEKCRKDYEANKCDTPLKGIKQFCEEKQKCLSNNFDQEMKIRSQGTLFLGTIIRQFFQGLGLPMILIGLVYAIWGNRKNSEVKKQFVEYYP